MAAKDQAAAPTTIGLNRYVHFGFLLAGFLLTVVLIKVIDSLWSRLWPTNDALVIGISLLVAGGATVYAWRHPRLNTLAKEIATELSKVTWPTRKETSAFTVTVIVSTIIAAMILGLFDVCWAALTGLFYS